jgi:hypothetical protein
MSIKPMDVSCDEKYFDEKRYDVLAKTFQLLLYEAMNMDSSKMFSNELVVNIFSNSNGRVYISINSDVEEILKRDSGRDD